MSTDITLKNNFDVPSLSSDSLQVYLNSIADIPVLSLIEEQKLAEKLQLCKVLIIQRSARQSHVLQRRGNVSV